MLVKCPKLPCSAKYSWILRKENASLMLVGSDGDVARTNEHRPVANHVASQEVLITI
jgi:hypothetical protein